MTEPVETARKRDGLLKMAAHLEYRAMCMAALLRDDIDVSLRKWEQQLGLDRHCPVCGLDLPWNQAERENKRCPCCLVQFGQNVLNTSRQTWEHAAWRDQWIREGMPWRVTAAAATASPILILADRLQRVVFWLRGIEQKWGLRPRAGWDPAAQLQQLGEWIGPMPQWGQHGGMPAEVLIKSTTDKQETLELIELVSRYTNKKLGADAQFWTITEGWQPLGDPMNLIWAGCEWRDRARVPHPVEDSLPAGLKIYWEENIREIRVEDAATAPAESECLVVIEVAAASLAAACGVKPGDWLVKIDGRPAAAEPPGIPQELIMLRDYLFYHPNRRQQTLVRASRIPLGMTLSASMMVETASAAAAARRERETVLAARAGELLPAARELALLNRADKREPFPPDTRYALADQFHLACFLGSARGDEAYERFMRDYLLFQRFFARHLSCLYIVTMNAESPAGAENLKAEARASRIGVAIAVLHDHDGASTPPEARAAPLVLALDAGNQVIHAGGFDDVRLWETMARCVSAQAAAKVEAERAAEAAEGEMDQQRLDEVLARIRKTVAAFPRRAFGLEGIYAANLCPVCGYHLGFPPWSGGSAADEICPGPTGAVWQSRAVLSW